MDMSPFPAKDGFDGVRERLDGKVEIKASTKLLRYPGRYICHCEDEPALFSRRYDEIGEAMQAAYDHVSLCLNQNGCGDGLVFDTFLDEIVAQFGHVKTYGSGDEELLVVGTVPLPDRARQEWMSWLVKAWDRDGSDNPPPLPFIWQTCS